MSREAFGASGLRAGMLSPLTLSQTARSTSTHRSGGTRHMNGFRDMVTFIWSVADLLRGDYKQSEYGKVILPLTVLRRLLADPEHSARSLRLYIDAFSPGAVEVREKYAFDAQITRLDESGLLYQVIARFADIDLHPSKVSNLQMGYVFEDLIRRFSEMSNETAGEHFTPREVIRLMVDLLLADESDTLTTRGIVKTLYDPACGTGGMLSTAEDWVRNRHADARLELFGQELNGETYAICRSDMMLKGHNAQNIAFGNSFSQDAHQGKTFDYMLANPPFGVEWKKVQTAIEAEAARGHAGRFGAGTPRINDGSLLFLQHMISKMKPVAEGGSRLAIVFNGSPLFTGAAGSGESEIRRWILENDWLEGIVALPDQLFYNTGISTYFWILSNRKRPEHRGKVILLDARDQFTKMRKSLGDKRKEISATQIDQITRWYADALEIAADPSADAHASVKILPTTAFGYQRITVERPLRLRFEVSDDAVAAIRASKPFRALAPDDAPRLVAALESLRTADGATRKSFERALTAALSSHDVAVGAPLLKTIWAAVSVPDPDGDLRDNENVPLGEDVDEYLAREVLPHVPDAWVDHTKTKIGYEIPFTRHFYVYTPPRPLAEIDAELKALEAEIQRLLGEVTS